MDIKSLSKNEQGYVLVTFIFLSAVLGSIILGTATTAEVLHTYRKFQYLCEKESLAIQTKQAKILRSLLMLNPRALKLRKQRKQAEKAYRIALQSKIPHAIAAAKAYLLLVKGQQLLHRLKQQSTLRKSSKAWVRYKANQSGRKLRNRQKVSIRSPNQLPVRKEGEKTGSPTYFPAEFFELKEQHFVSWTQVHKSKGNFLKTLTGKSKLSIEVSCGGTLERRGRKWTPNLR